MSSESDQTDRADQIAARAYAKWVRLEAGNPFQDWLDAEKEVGRLQILTQRVGFTTALPSGCGHPAKKRTRARWERGNTAQFCCL